MGVSTALPTALGAVQAAEICYYQLYSLLEKRQPASEIPRPMVELPSSCSPVLLVFPDLGQLQLCCWSGFSLSEHVEMRGSPAELPYSPAHPGDYVPMGHAPPKKCV